MSALAPSPAVLTAPADFWRRFLRQRNAVLGGTIVVLVVLAAVLAPASVHAQSSGKTLNFIPEADLKSLDPIWTTAYITRNYGYMVYDTLFALDEHFKVQPQMVETWTVNDDKLVYTITLRPGLKWHDGAPVRPEDCIASLEQIGRAHV